MEDLALSAGTRLLAMMESKAEIVISVVGLAVLSLLFVVGKHVARRITTLEQTVERSNQKTIERQQNTIERLLADNERTTAALHNVNMALVSIEAQLGAQRGSRGRT